MLAKLIETVKTYALINHKCSNTVHSLVSTTPHEHKMELEDT